MDDETREIFKQIQNHHLKNIAIVRDAIINAKNGLTINQIVEITQLDRSIVSPIVRGLHLDETIVILSESKGDIYFTLKNYNANTKTYLRVFNIMAGKIKY